MPPVKRPTLKRRSYRTSIKRGDAPRLVVAAATKLFATKGYLATSNEDIAAEAGVARPTVFTAVGPKSVILREVLDQAIAGDDAAVPVAERDWWRQTIEEPDAATSIKLLARTMTRIGERLALIARAVETAASIDPDAAEAWDRYQQQRRIGLREFAESLTTKRTPTNQAVVRCDVDTMTDTLWTLQPSAYLRLVADAGWTLERYEAWLADLLTRLFLE
jgi:AcrR family transcriptional regulator